MENMIIDSIPVDVSLTPTRHPDSDVSVASRQANLQDSFALGYQKLLLIFTVGSVFGLLFETAFHIVMYGAYQSRAGLVWGPFSPIYGFGAVILTVLLSRIWRSNWIVVFIVSMATGLLVEFVVSWSLEACFGAVAWDYSNTILNIDGRINLYSGLLWGALGLFWARLVMPYLARELSLVNWKHPLIKTGCVLLTVFLLANCTVTLMAFERESSRLQGIPATTSLDHLLDEHFPSTWMESRFENLAISGTSEDK